MSDGAWDGDPNGPKNRVRDSVGYNSETQYVLEKRISALEAENQRLKIEMKRFKADGVPVVIRDAVVDKLREELQAAKLAMDGLRAAVADYIIKLDKLMVGPSTYERGKAQAAIVGDLQIAWEDTEPKKIGKK